MAQVDFGKIVNRSFYLTKKHKWLWVYGLVLAAASGSSYSNFNLPGGNSNTSTESNPSQLMETIQNQEKVLGDATTWLTQSLSQVPPTTWLLLVLGVLALIIVGIALNWVTMSFAKAALISGINAGDEGETVDLKTTGKKGWLGIKPIIRLQIRILAVTLAALIVSGVGLFIVALAFGAVQMQFMVWLVGIVMVVALAVLFVLLAMVQIYAERLIVIKGMSAKDAFNKAFSLSKGNFLHTVVMGVINMVLGCAGGCLAGIAVLILIGIPALIVLIPSFARGVENFQMPNVFAIGFLILLALLAFAGMLVFRAAIVVFTYSTWTLLFKQVIANEQE